MKKLVTLAMIAVTFAGSLIVTTGEADARSRRYRDRDAAAAAAVGVVGALIVGGLIASQARDRDDYYYYDRGYRRPPPRAHYYGGGYYGGGDYYRGGYHRGHYDRGDRAYYGGHRGYGPGPRIGAGTSVNEFVPGSR